MNLDLTSFAFGFTVTGSNCNPNWATSFGQGAAYKINENDSVNELLKGLIYMSSPLSLLQTKIGKGGHLYNGADVDSGIMLGSVFDKIYVNGSRVPRCKFILIVTKDKSESHSGRLRLKYSPHNAFLRTTGTVQFSNADGIEKIRDFLGLKTNACWFVYEMKVVDQDQLHLSVGIANSRSAKTYASIEDLHNDWRRIIKANGGVPTPTPLSLTDDYQKIVYGAPGTGKSFGVEDEVKTMGMGEENAFRTTFHPDSDYSTFVGAYKPTKEDGDITYEFVPQAFINAYVAAWKKYVAKLSDGEGFTGVDRIYLVIEEINRGHCAQIFGDLFQLLDRNEYGFSDYPINADIDLAKWLGKQFAHECELVGEGSPLLPALEGKKLCLPPNLYIRATMNTSDQSLFPMDSAFKRRWDWQFVPISKPEEEGFKDREIVLKVFEENGEVKKDAEGKDVVNRFNWWAFLENINEHILKTTKSEDKQLGYFFVKAPDATGEITAEKFAGKVLFYLYNDVFKDYNYPDAVFAKKGSTPKVKFAFKDFFDAKGKAKDGVVTEFLENLGLTAEG